MTDPARHVSASPDDQPTPWSKERRSRVSAANRAATPQAPLTAETKTKPSNSGEAETPLRLRDARPPDLYHCDQREELTMNAPSETRLLLRVDGAGRRLNLGRTVMYELIRSGRLRSVKVGKLRLIPTSALVEFVDQLGGAA
jgi:excisionase family DNA binding protein